MPKLWDETIEAHRQSVQDATLETTAQLVAERGLRGVTMSEIAKKTGIGRATLYKYFPDVEAILVAWHERHIGAHLQSLVEVRDRFDDPARALEAVLGAHALHTHESRNHLGSELAALVHSGSHVAEARDHLVGFVQGLLDAAAAAGNIRNDVAAAELADFCLSALSAATNLPSEPAVHRLVDLTMDALRGPRGNRRPAERP